MQAVKISNEAAYRKAGKAFAGHRFGLGKLGLMMTILFITAAREVLGKSVGAAVNMKKENCFLSMVKADGGGDGRKPPRRDVVLPDWSRSAL